MSELGARFRTAKKSRITQRDLIAAALAQAKKQSRFGGLASILGTGVGLLGSLIPGLGPLGFAAGKGLTKLLMGGAYKPTKFESGTGWGLDRYKQLAERGSRFKSGMQEGAITGFGRDAIMGLMYPKMFDKFGTSSVGQKIKGLFGGGGEAAIPGVQPMTSLGGARTALGGNKLSLDLGGAAPIPGFGGAQMPMSAGQVPLQDLRSAMSAESLSSMLGQHGGAVPGLGNEWQGGLNMAPKLGFPEARPFQEQMQLGQQFQLPDVTPTHPSAFRLPESWGVMPEVPMGQPSVDWSALNPQQRLLESAFGPDMGVGSNMPMQQTGVPMSFAPWDDPGYLNPQFQKRSYPGLRTSGVPTILGE